MTPCGQGVPGAAPAGAIAGVAGTTGSDAIKCTSLEGAQDGPGAGVLGADGQRKPIDPSLAFLSVASGWVGHHERPAAVAAKRGHLAGGAAVASYVSFAASAGAGAGAPDEPLPGELRELYDRLTDGLEERVGNTFDEAYDRHFEKLSEARATPSGDSRADLEQRARLIRAERKQAQKAIADEVRQLARSKPAEIDRLASDPQQQQQQPDQQAADKKPSSSEDKPQTTKARKKGKPKSDKPKFKNNKAGRKDPKEDGAKKKTAKNIEQRQPMRGGGGAVDTDSGGDGDGGTAAAAKTHAAAAGSPSEPEPGEASGSKARLPGGVSRAANAATRNTLGAAPEPRLDAKASGSKPQQRLTCPSPSNNTTPFDHLAAIVQRNELPQVATLPFSRQEASSRASAEESVLAKHYSRHGPDLIFFNGVGQLHRLLGNTTHAIDCFRAALLLNPSDKTAMLNLADLIFKLEYWSDAEDILREVLLLPGAQDDQQNHYALGRAYMAQGKITDANQAFRRSLALNPNFMPARIALDTNRALARSMHAPDFTSQTLTVIATCIVATLTGLILFLVESDDDVAPPAPAANGSGRPQPNRPTRGFKMSRLRKGVIMIAAIVVVPATIAVLRELSDMFGWQLFATGKVSQSAQISGGLFW